VKAQPFTTAAVLGAVLPPLPRSSDSDPDPEIRKQRASRSSKPRRATRRKRKKSEPRLRANGAEPTDGPRERAIAALKANSDATLAEVAKAAGVSHGTAINARDELAAEARKAARKETRRRSREKSKAAQPERRRRAQRFLKDALAQGPKPVADLEEAAEKAHIDAHTLGQARADLGVVTSRGNAGGVQAVQWSLPG
jgi:hypothetical protein